jgi:molecular chaperone HscB
VAAALASQPDRTRHCEFCDALTAPEGVSVNLCPKCGQPQPVRADEDYFSILSAPIQFEQDVAKLERKFYELSRELHPDRFGTASAQARQNSLERMSLVNQAYRSLKDPSSRRQYLLERVTEASPAEPAKKNQIPLELAEGWFELQDFLSENSPSSPESTRRILEFETELAKLAESKESLIRSLESRYDSTREKTVLGEIRKEIQSLSYLTSLKRDVDRIKLQRNAGD